MDSDCCDCEVKDTEISRLTDDLSAAERTIAELRAELAAATEKQGILSSALDRISDQAREALRN